ncbi:hypothetical protein FEM48_ZijujUnG0101800 [Ziziphus jujuba var. spinosa]|uniref:Red chlorophyll catabolite reductase, chloroplastic-like n=1 Tax=Ziziphus jujuba var. spinosa TaxID=714518 RepID=A0A978U891_ZIZJJ|nr:hypothetical protein FEM48_ZijujUnG0101800 [Ziziphus jujuba var. spinosa]
MHTATLNELMAVSFCNFFHSSFSSFSSSKPYSLTSACPLPPSRTSRLSRPRISASSTSSPIMEFPYVSPPHRNLMVDLLSTVETRLDSHLLPSSLPPDVQSFQNRSGTAHGSPHQIRPRLLPGSWLHSELPTRGAINITSLSSYLSSTTDAPNFFIDIIQSSPTSLILILDLPPRKDLAFHPDYLQTFYEDTKLDAPRQTLERIPEVKPYFSSSLWIRSFFPPLQLLFELKPTQVVPDVWRRL